jgi:outer membrane protein TolC
MTAVVEASPMPELPADTPAVRPASPNSPQTQALLPTDLPTEQPLGLGELESLACRHNPTLVQAQAHVSAAYGKAVEAGLYPNPEIGYMGEQLGVKGTAGEFHGGFFRQEIVTAGKLRLSRAKFLQRMKISELEALAQQYRVLNDVRIHYYQALAANRQVKIHRELVKNAEDRLLTTRELANVGQANQVDLHQANVALGQARLDLQMAEIDYGMAWEGLASVVGVDLEPCRLGGMLEGDTTPIDWHAALAHLYGRSPELAKAWAKYRADQITLRREQAEPVPNLVVTGAVGYNAEAEETVAGVEMSLEGRWDTA